MSSDNTAAAQLVTAAAAATAQRNSPTEQTAPPTSAAPAASSNATASDNSHRCLWEGCSERFGGPEALYEHICDRHIGRKSTNNLNLECRWANCKTKTVKRDHITSHVRVHVPHKPHRCPICNKAFKRPQDLKKHHKTHAEDSGPSNAAANGQGPNGHQTGHPGHNGYGGMGAAPAPGTFYPHMPGGMGMNFGAYQPPQGAYYGQPHQNMGTQYGGTSVYYTAGDGGPGTQASYARHADTLQALNSVFGAIKQPNFNATSYSEFSPALAQMHGVALPPPVSSHGIDYSVPHVDGTFMQQHGQHYPNIRSKNDLLLIEERLNKMMHAINTHDRNTVSIAPMGPGATGASYPTTHLPSSHQNGPATSEQTPALTPDSSHSHMSYGSAGHSPSSDHSSMVSPGPSTGPAYPRLHGDVSLGATGSGSSVPTLGNQYDPSGQQRYEGGRLTRAQPAEGRAPTTERRPARSKRVQDANIDPALVGSPPTSSSSSEHTTTPAADNGEQAAEGWVRDVRIVGDLIKIVRGMIDEDSSPHSEEAQDPGQGSSHATSGEQADEMEDIKHEISYPDLPGLSK